MVLLQFHLALILLDVSQGDDVICSSFTFSATVNPVKYLGANPVLIDSDSDSWNMCPELLELAIKEGIAINKNQKQLFWSIYMGCLLNWIR